MPLRNLVTIPRFDSFLAKVFGLKERSVSPTIATEIIPTVQVTPSDAAELYFVRGERLCAYHQVVDLFGSSETTITSVAVFGNPGRSGVLATVEAIQFYPAPESSIDISHLVKLDCTIAPAILPGLPFPDYLLPPHSSDWLLPGNDGTFADTRWATNSGMNSGYACRLARASVQAPALGPMGGSLAFSGIAALSCTGALPAVATANPYEYRHPIVLRPGAAIRMLCTYRFPVPSSIKLDIRWRERPLEDAEIRAGSS